MEGIWIWTSDMLKFCSEQLHLALSYAKIAFVGYGPTCYYDIIIIIICPYYWDFAANVLASEQVDLKSIINIRVKKELKNELN